MLCNNGAKIPEVSSGSFCLAPSPWQSETTSRLVGLLDHDPHHKVRLSLIEFAGDGMRPKSQFAKVIEMGEANDSRVRAWSKPQYSSAHVGISCILLPYLLLMTCNTSQTTYSVSPLLESLLTTRFPEQALECV